MTERCVANNRPNLYDGNVFNDIYIHVLNHTSSFELNITLIIQ